MEIPEKKDLKKLKCRCGCKKSFEDGGFIASKKFKHFFCSVEGMKKWNAAKGTSFYPIYKVDGYDLTGPYQPKDIAQFS